MQANSNVSKAAQFLGFAAGASNLGAHSPAARQLVYAISSALLFVTFPLAFLGMAIYSSSNFLTAEMTQLQQYALIGGCGLLWAMVVTIGVDRTLLVASDAASKSKSWIVGLVIVRFTIAILLSSLVADEIILWRYRSQIQDAQTQIANEARLKLNGDLTTMHGVAEKDKLATDAAAQLAARQAERRQLPEQVIQAQSRANVCDSNRQVLSARYVALREKVKDDPSLRAGMLSIGQQLADKRRECTRLTTEAATARNDFLLAKDTEINAAKNSQTSANDELSKSRTSRDAEVTTQSQSTVKLWKSGSSREAAFTRVKAERADIKRNSQVIWLALLLLELLPLIVKLFAKNNPVVEQARAQLEADSSAARIRQMETEGLEIAFAEALVSDAYKQAAIGHALNIQDAAAPFIAFEAIVERAVAAEERLSRMKLSASTQDKLREALVNAQAASFESLANSFK